jgi:hypothetical protein
MDAFAIKLQQQLFSKRMAARVQDLPVSNRPDTVLTHPETENDIVARKLPQLLKHMAPDVWDVLKVKMKNSMSDGCYHDMRWNCGSGPRALYPTRANVVDARTTYFDALSRRLHIESHSVQLRSLSKRRSGITIVERCPTASVSVEAAVRLMETMGRLRASTRGKKLRWAKGGTEKVQEKRLRRFLESVRRRAKQLRNAIRPKLELKVWLCMRDYAVS